MGEEQGILKIEEVAAVGTEAEYSPWGYLIGADGTIYSLYHRWFHGVALAILFPDLAKEMGYPPPIHPLDANNVFKFQAFELDNKDHLPMIRVALGMLCGNFNVSKGYGPATDAQVDGLRKVMHRCGVGMKDKIHLDFGDMTAQKALVKIKGPPESWDSADPKKPIDQKRWRYS